MCEDSRHFSICGRLYFKGKLQPFKEPLMRRPCPLPESLWICWSFFAENPLGGGKSAPWPVGGHQPSDSKGSKDTTVTKILTDVPPLLRWKQLGMTLVSSVTSQETICACAYWSQGVMIRWGLFLASRKRISRSCRAYWTLRSNMPYVRPADVPCWTTAILSDMGRRVKRKRQKVWQ